MKFFNLDCGNEMAHSVRVGGVWFTDNGYGGHSPQRTISKLNPIKGKAQVLNPVGIKR